MVRTATLGAMKLCPLPKVLRAPWLEAGKCVSPTRTTGRQPRSACGRFQLDRSGDASSRQSRLRPLGQPLGAALIIAAVAASARAQSGVTLAWDPGPSSGLAGYHLYEGGASRTYTNVMAVGNVTTQTVSSLTIGATYFFAVTAYDLNGMESDFSTEISYTVPAPSHSPRTIGLSSPTIGAVYTAPATISVAANVIANGQKVTQVQFYNGATLLGGATVAPYSFAWNNVSAGTNSLSAKAVYDSGSTIASAAVSVTVIRNKRPTLSINRATCGVNGSVVLGQPSPQLIILDATGDPGQTYNIQSSPDLKTWTPIGAMTLDATGCCQFTNSAGASGTKGFYRLLGQ